MTRALSCPDAKELGRFLLGHLSPDVSRQVESHLSECQVCQATMHSVEANDTLVEAVRARAAAGPMPESEEVADLVSRLKEMTPPSARAETEVDMPRDTEKPDLSEILAPPQGPDEIGRLGTYRVLKLLGAGGMGMVFLAEDTQLRRKVALKTMLPNVVKNPQNRERFLREARAAAAIEHPHIVAIFQVGEDNGVPYLAMPFLKGESLEDRLARTRKLPVADALRIAEEMAEGLAAAHAGGLIHRDIKPANVWLETRPRRGAAGGMSVVKLLDFGLARSQGDDTNLTQSGAIVGTPAFMAPEQARGLAIDGRADLFSLGCVLYVMLTGERPFQGDTTMGLLTALALDTPKAPREVNRDVPAELSGFVMRLLEKQPHKRPASAREVAETLARMGGATVATPNPWADLDAPDRTERLAPPPLPKAAPKTKPGKRRLLPLVAVGLLLALVGVGVVYGGTIYRLATNQGELVIEVDDKDVEVKIVRDGLVVQDKTAKREFTLTAGKGEIEVLERDGGIKLATKQFELTRNGKTTVKVTLGELAAARKPKPKVEQQPPGGVADRKAAEYVLSIGGAVRVNGEDRDIKAVADLPRDVFRLTQAALTRNQQVSDAGLASFEGCKSLTHLSLGGTQLSEAGLAHFKDCKDLSYLDIGGTQVGDAGFANFNECKNMTFLHLSLTQVGDAGLAHFKECKSLTTLNLYGTKVGNAGLAQLKDYKKLYSARV